MVKTNRVRSLISILGVLAALSWTGDGLAQQSTPDNDAAARLVAAAVERTRSNVTYDGSYHGLVE